ncbi:flagellar biosynthesis protein FlhB [Aestuariivirga litoralis]|uniref:flagellar biosynthesis protein FlhB n=1 Tax=Aestuariivirga litoralis TaxID=2650924 RepID=UPI0018C5336D|nr:flagellar biosynthesis protein FlhB [Aestuariivirga litoralis]MBG1233200.1 flagellar biosynthesis protein FlhB [Aestuariivirga litoralis]
MSDAADHESKTEEPSQKRIQDTIEKGNVPFSKEVVTFISLGGALLAISLTGAASTRRLFEILYGSFDHLEDISFENGADAAQILSRYFQGVFLVLLPFVAVIAIGGIIGSIGQNVPSIAGDRLMPKLERISPAANFKRIFGSQGLMEFAKSVAKITVVCLLLYRVFKGSFNELAGSLAGDIGHLPQRIMDFTLAMLAPVCVFAFLLAIFDTVITRMRWYRNLRMTRQELKDEFKQSEGDQQLKERIKHIGRSRVRKRMMAELPKATVVVVNPTHYAVAMRYVPSEGGAPLVLAKGVDSLALKIRKYCEDNNISVIEDKTLARALHKSCEVGTMIPPEFYKAVAEIIHFIEMKKRMPRRAA